MTEPDGIQDDVNREDAVGNIFGVPVMDRVLIEIKPTDLSVQVVTGSLVRWAARYPTLNIQLDGLYLTWTEVGPAHVHVGPRRSRRCPGVGPAEGHQRGVGCRHPRR